MDQEMFEALAELRQLQAERMAAAEEKQITSDSFGYPFEPSDAIDDDPVSFEESTAALWKQYNEIYRNTRRLNRCSPVFTKYSHTMEKLTRQLGSCCVTRAVLEQKGFAFPSLSGLSMETLYRVASYNFRKCNLGMDKLREESGVNDLMLLELMSSWHYQLERLKTTEEKIRRIQSGELDADSMLKRVERSRENHSAIKEGPADDMPKTPVIQKAPAYPLMRQVAEAELDQQLAASDPEQHPIPAVVPDFDESLAEDIDSVSADGQKLVKDVLDLMTSRGIPVEFPVGQSFISDEEIEAAIRGLADHDMIALPEAFPLPMPCSP